jgi:hypothetical protein
VDKHFFVTGKIIDLLLEEEAHERGINLHEGDHARQLAWTLFDEGPRALGEEGFDRLIETMVSFASTRNGGVDVLLVGAENKSWLVQVKRREHARSPEPVSTAGSPPSRWR